MEITDFTLKLLILFFPGVIGSLVVEFLTNHKRREWKHFLLITYIFSFFSYGIYWGIADKTTFFSNLLSSNWDINVKEIIYTTIISIILSIIISLIINKKWFYDFAIWTKLTNHYGSYDVWDTTLSGPVKKNEVTWVVVRNKDTGLIYQGQLYLYSDSQEKQELTLRHVAIFLDNKGKISNLGERQMVYIDISKMDNVAIEIDVLPIDGGENHGEE